MKPQHNYHKDFYAWAMHNAELIRNGNFNKIDNQNIAEELESMGKSDKRELINRFAVLIAHLLNIQTQGKKYTQTSKIIVE
jgi:hypothetical protein